MVFLCSVANALDIFLGTSRHGFEKIQINLLHFESGKENEERALLLETIFEQDLVRSQLFRVVKPTPPLNLSLGHPDANQLVSAANQGIQVVAFGKLIREGEKWLLESVAYETQTGKRIVGIRIVGEEQSIQTLAHRFSNRLVSALTGRLALLNPELPIRPISPAKKRSF